MSNGLGKSTVGIIFMEACMERELMDLMEMKSEKK